METVLPDGPRGQILAAALTLCLLAALWFGAAAPLIEFYHDRGEQLAQRQALLVRMQALADSLPLLEHQAAGSRPATAALLPGNTDALAAAAMQSMVQSMASAAGLELASMETLPAEVRGPYRGIGLRVSLSASWLRLIALLRSAAQSQPRMVVEELQLRAPLMQDRSADAPVNATFVLLAFRAAADGGRS
jgi:hypothetical protein